MSDLTMRYLLSEYSNLARKFEFHLFEDRSKKPYLVYLDQFYGTKSMIRLIHMAAKSTSPDILWGNEIESSSYTNQRERINEYIYQWVNPWKRKHNLVLIEKTPAKFVRRNHYEITENSIVFMKGIYIQAETRPWRLKGQFNSKFLKSLEHIKEFNVEDWKTKTKF